MSANENENTVAPEAAAVDEMALLRERAQRMGVQVAPNMKLETLRKRVNDATQGIHSEPTNEERIADAVQAQAVKTHSLMEEVSGHARKLVRASIICNDPSRKDLKGEIFTISGKYFGTIRRLVPYSRNAAEGWHVEYALLQMLQRKRYYRVNQQVDRNSGRASDASELVPLFTITILPDLTPEELAELARIQAAQG